LALQLKAFKHLAHLIDLVGFGFPALLGLEVQQDRNSWPGENVVVAFNSHLPASLPEEMDHFREAMAVIFPRVSQRSSDLL
jgi:hypothetical protein